LNIESEARIQIQVENDGKIARFDILKSRTKMDEIQENVD
jgi:hypothetical protein